MPASQLFPKFIFILTMTVFVWVLNPTKAQADPIPTLRATCNVFGNSNTASCSFFLTDTTVTELKKIKNFTLKIGTASQDYSDATISGHADAFGYVILDYAPLVPISLLKASSGVPQTPIYGLATNAVGLDTQINLNEVNIAKAVMPPLEYQFQGRGFTGNPHKSWTSKSVLTSADSQKLKILRISKERTYWAANIKIADFGGYMGAQRLSSTTDSAIFSLWNAGFIANDLQSKSNCVFNEQMEGPQPGFSCIKYLPATYKQGDELLLKITRVANVTSKLTPTKIGGTFQMIPSSVTADDHVAWFRGTIGNIYVGTIGMLNPTDADLKPVITSNFTEVFDFFRPKVQSIVTFNPPASAKSGSLPHTISYLYDLTGPQYAQKNTAYIGGTVLASYPGLINRNQCQFRASRNKNSDGYTYLADERICELKQGKIFVPSPFAPAWVSGIKLSSKFSYRENSYSAGEILNATPAVDSILECQLICEQNAACLSFTFRQSDRVCEEKNGKAQFSVPANTLWFSGVKLAP